MMNAQREKAARHHHHHHPWLLVATVLLTALWLIGASFQTVLLPPVTSFFAERTVNDALSEFDHKQLVEVAETGRAFVVGEKGATLPAGSDYRVSFPPDVLGHMEDVRVVIQGAQLATLALTVLLVFILVLTGRRAGRAVVGTGLLLGGIGALAVVLVLALVGAFNFDALFANMHRIFFAEGTWTFAEDSLLICAYPLPFWIGMGIAWAVALVFLSTFFATVGFLIRKPRVTGARQ
jgi:integral membrane protein (TIGR01906 family)